MNIDKLLSQFKDYHIVVCTGIFAAGSVLQWFHHLDYAYVTFVSVVVGGITGHAFSPAQKDHDQ